MSSKAALYVRVSTSHQIDKDSLPFQKQELTNYSKYALGIDDYEIFEDAGYSAKNTDRPKYQEMMARIRNKEFSHLLVWKLDRISRNLKDFTEMYEELNECNITFVSKNEQFDTSSAMGEAMLKIILVFAELERKLTGERVFSIMLSRAEKGMWNGATVPLGYVWSDEKKFPVIDDAEAAIVRYVYELYEKLFSTTQVAYTLNAENIKTKRGGKWTAKTISDILHNPFYVGTYRYNYKTSGKRRIKDESEWILVENNHPAIITKEQQDRVVNMLSSNFKGFFPVQRSNTGTHIFSRIIFCNKCGLSMVSGFDAARNDGYRPSRYVCYSMSMVGQYESDRCNNFISDISLLPFILNYISNFINLQNRIAQRHSLRDIERILLRGSAFIDVLGIDKKALEETYLSFSKGFDSEYFVNTDFNSEISTDYEFETLKKEKQKFEKALARLEDLFLFSEEAMSEKDFLFKKRDIVNNIERINSSISAVNKKSLAAKSFSDTSFLNKASNFFILNEMNGTRDIDYREFLEVIDKDLIKEFIRSIISKIIVQEKRVISITFVNGLTHNFIYKPIEKRKILTQERFLYRKFELVLTEYLKDHISVSRPEVEKLTGLSLNGASSLIKCFIANGTLEQRGNSIAIRYFVIQKNEDI